MARAREWCADHGGTPEDAKAGDAHLEGAAGIWRNAFIRMPYMLNPGVLIDP
jgi:alkyldihydroxyacetonephosphate synthase